MLRSEVLFTDHGEARFWGENAIDKYLIDNYLKHITQGTYVECGAANGFYQSNTVILDYGYEWNGILVEPNPHNFETLKSHRYNVFTANCALVSHEYKEEYIEGFFEGTVSPDTYGNHVVTAGEASEKEFNDMLSGQIKTNHNYDKKRFPTDEKLAEVAAKTLDFIFDASPFNEADFFSLDVEGYELEVLKGWSPEKYPITYVLLEGGGRPGVTPYMEQNNYTLIEEIYGNSLFKKKS
jgi:FkbM family methyltransferase